MAVVLVCFRIRSEILDQGFPGGRVEGGKGFIEKKDLGLNGKGPGKACPLGLSSGKGSGRTLAEVGDAEPVQVFFHNDVDLGPSHPSDLQP